MNNRLAALVLAFAAALLPVACSTTPAAKFFTLNDGSGGAPSTGQSALVLAIGPIDLPQYLDRPQIVTRVGGNRLGVDEFNRWGGRLDEEITRVLAQHIGRELGTQRVYSYPSRIAPDVDYRIGLDIRGFDGARGGEVSLDVAWSLIADRSAKVLVTHQTLYRSTTGGEDYGAYAAALSETLVQLGDDLVEALQRLEPQAKVRQGDGPQGLPK